MPPPPAPPPPAPPTTTGIEGDPHLTFAHGGKADFRGQNGMYFNFLSTSNISVNLMTEDGVFKLHGATVHGSWLTQAHVVATTSAGTLHVSYYASIISPNSLIGWSNGTCAGEKFKLVGWALTPLRDGPKNRRQCGEVRVQSDYSSIRLTLPEWNITIAPKAVPSYYHRDMWVSGPRVRLDVQFALRVPERSLRVAPHGIVGQSFDGSGVGVDGARDPVPQSGLNLTTTAMAEGSIEGSWRDYLVGSPFATGFAFSRFGLSEAPPRDVAALTGRKFLSNAPFAIASVDGEDESGDVA